MAKRELPEQHKQVLNNPSLGKIERMREVERINDLGYSQQVIADAMGVSTVQLANGLKVVKEDDPALHQLVSDGWLTLSEAAEAISTKAKSGRKRYPFDYKFCKSDGVVLYEHRPVRIFDRYGKYYICASLFGKPIYRIDDSNFPIEVVRKLIDDGYVIRSNLNVIAPNGDPVGDLAQHLLAALYHVDRSGIRNIKTINAPTEKNEAQDYRISNLLFSDMESIVPQSASTSVRRVGDDIAILRKAYGIMGYTDYSEQMMRILTGFGAIHTRAPDKRLSIFIDGYHDYYIHSLRVALDLYGLPDDFTAKDVIAMMQRFRAEYTSGENKMSVDHLDGNAMNNRLSNLIIISRNDNHIKQTITASIEKINPNLFCWMKRDTATTVKMQAGYMSQFEPPIFWVDKVIHTDDLIDELRDVVNLAEEHEICLSDVSSAYCDVGELDDCDILLYGYMGVARKRAEFLQKTSEKTDKAEPDAGEDEESEEI